MIRFKPFCLIVCLLVPPSEAAWGEIIAKLPPGLVVEQSKQSVWNRILLIASPRISSGDVDAIGTSIQTAVARFRLTIMAQVRYESQSSQYTLSDVGAGYATMINGRLTVVDSENATELGASLGFIERRLLSENEAQRNNIRVIVRTTTLLLFDVPAIFNRANKHRHVINRHLVWISQNDGKLSLATWLFDSDKGLDTPWATDPLRIVSENTREDRTIHVDEDQFFLGFPNESAFALETLPPGSDFSWTPELKKLACRESYDVESLKQLTDAINDVGSGSK